MNRSICLACIAIATLGCGGPELGRGGTGIPESTLPPDPGPAGLETLEGIDRDNDGIRDDLQRYIALEIETTNPKQRAATNLVVALQSAIRQQNDLTEITNELLAATDCLLLQFDSDAASVLNRLENLSTNTPDRFDAYIEFNRSLDGFTSTVDTPQPSEEACDDE